MAQLDLIVTHYNESWDICRKFFEMLRLQRGVFPGDFSVILVQDGPDEKLDLRRILKVYPFVESVIELPHMGVSGARNSGLAHSEAEWVMFCDCDDCLYSVDSMFRIMESIRQAGDKADLLWSELWIEYGEGGESRQWAKKKKGWNNVFIHGKVFRRQFLIDHNLRFDPELTYSEDAMFIGLITMEIDPTRIAKMPEIVYMWCYRKESLSNYTGGNATRNLCMLRKRIKTAEAFAERGLDYDTACSVGRSLLDYYWEINGQDEMAGMSKSEWEERVRMEFAERWPGALQRISEKDRATIWNVAKQEAALKHLAQNGLPSVNEWLRKIGAIE